MPTETEATETVSSKATLTVGEYKGTPMLVASVENDGEKDRYPFQFGPSKAKKLLAAIQAHGIDNFMATLEQIAKSKGE